MNRKSILLGSLVVVSLVSGVLFLSNEGEANAPSPIPADIQPIVDKMIDSVDNYKFVTAVVQVDSENGADSTTSFSAKLEPRVKVKSEYIDKRGQSIQQFQNNGKTLTVDLKQKTFSAIPISRGMEQGWKDRPRHRFTYLEDGKFRAQPRMSPFHVGLGAESMLFPQDFALGVMHRSADLQISSHEAMLGRDATVIEGTPNEVHLDSYGDHFKIWVDTETGILLKSEFSNDGQVFETQTMTKLELDNPVSDAKFDFPSVKEYKNATP
ncbi:hypothetical protein CBW65_03980 [Tumebacillus avium]|uniref:MucB/RseB N-terminal domain-containing protein n=1 Tax=Tumebacillus avium TaxID=1903704 RepID=A0A1Y0ILW9_9BACL|nr:sigma-E factor regulatory protein RseB domain-containing protein [Tumebacillus avium]ARU60314.1 hypothetical protein CBW65_03980 [Tumebacillus avium]